MAITENDVRLIRQRLAAIEEGRDGDARLIAAYLVTKRQLQLEDVTRRVAGGAYCEQWGVPGTVDRMTMLLAHAREPVYRIPRDHATRAVSSMEIPEYVPDELVGSVRLADGPLPVEVRPSAQRAGWLSRFLTGSS